MLKSVFIPSGNKLEEKISALDIHGKAADLVNDKHPVFVIGKPDI